MNYKKTIPAALLLIIVSALYYYLALQNAIYVNTNPGMNDQQSYMNIVYRMSEDPTYLGDRNRMPLYPYLQTLIYTPQMTNQKTFLYGKYANIVFSAVLLWLIYFVVKKHISNLGSIVFTLISTFALFIFKSPYYQAEVLYYFMSFVSFIWLTKLFISDDTKTAFVTGAVVAATYLTKASILLAVIIFVSLKLIQIIIVKFEHKKKNIDTTSSTLLFLVTFLLVLSPYLIQNKLTFERYFYNVGTTFYIWYDSWEQVENDPYSTKKYNDRNEWPQIPEEHLPSLQNYLKDHTAADITNRMFSGISKNLQILTINYVIPFTIFIFIYSIILFVRMDKAAAYLINNKNKFIFPVAFFAAYFLSYSWYMSIESSPRFIQSLFLPLLFSLMYLNEKIDIEDNKFFTSRNYHIAALIILLAMLPQIAYVASYIYSGA